MWLISIVFVYVVYRMSKIVNIYFDYKRLKASGVAFNDKQGFHIFRDILMLKNLVKECPEEFPIITFQKIALGV